MPVRGLDPVIEISETAGCWCAPTAIFGRNSRLKPFRGSDVNVSMPKLRSFHSADAALAGLAEHDDGERTTTIRVMRRDGTIVEGTVVEINADSITVSEAASVRPVNTAHTEITSLEVLCPHRSREWLVAAVGIPLVVALMVGIRRLPGVGAKTDVSIVVLALYFLGTLVGPFVLTRTRFGRWLHRWRYIFPA